MGMNLAYIVNKIGGKDMKSKEYIVQQLLVTLQELEAGGISNHLKEVLRVKLEVYYSLLDEEDIPEEYWDRIEEQL